MGTIADPHPGTIRRSLGFAQRWLPAGGTLPEAQWRVRHRAILGLLWLHVIGIPIYGVYQGKGIGHSLFEALIVAVPGVVASVPRLGRHLRTRAAALAILSSSAVLVHLSSGFIEMHFHFFVMVAVVALYQDWVPFLLAVGYVFVHHGLIGAIDPGSVYNHAPGMLHPWRWAAIHALFITGISVTCLVTWRLNEKALAAAERARQRLGLLAEASRTMASSLDLDTTLNSVARLCVPTFADACYIDLLVNEDTVRRAAAHAGLRAQDDDRGTSTVDDHAPLGTVLRTSRPLVLRDVERLQGVAHNPVPEEAMLVPLPGRDGILGAVTFIAAAGSNRRFGRDDLSQAEELGRRLAAAVENARRFAHERSVAETLQRSLLPEQLPEIPGIATAVRYAPAGEGEQVGGDWYDVFVVPGGGIAAVLGDVIGKGIPAASLMGQLRNAIRAHAMDGLSPTEVVEKLNRLMDRSDPFNSLATLVFAELNPADCSLRVVNAGHPPLAVLRNDGSVWFGEEGVSVPVGALPKARFIEQRFELEPGDTLFLYTDGLIEDRATNLEDGLGRLTEALRGGPKDLEALCDHVVGRLLQGRTLRDDIAIMAMKLLPLGDRMTLQMANDPRMLASLRATLRRWLTRAGASEEETFEVLVAAGEASANAIEHAHGPRSARFEVEAALDGGVSITVRDQGRWRLPRPSSRGRGIEIMRAFMDTVELHKSKNGTEVKLYRSLKSRSGT